MTTNDLATYYANLLIIQYLGKTRAFNTMKYLCGQALLPQVSTQSIAFSAVAASGTFILNYDSIGSTAAINWNDNAAAIQTKIQAITGLGSVTVSGSIASQTLVVTFTGVVSPAIIMTTSANSLLTAGSVAITVTITETDLTLPLAVQAGFDVNTAVGAQLDLIGKYAGVSRSGIISSGPVTLGDSDFRQLIKVAVIANSSNGTLYAIQQLLNTYFPAQILVFDYQNMHMSYLISSSVGSQSLAKLFVAEGLLPRPMGVQLANAIYAPVINRFFGFRTYDNQPINNAPFNTYDVYRSNSPWLSYANSV